ncbi:MAG: hypothetical protein FD174_197 [Geobacteraceae bacterium]|nr:MAG: hypothetical protein FD174_197 [Geobacteraceae bacterium]
MQGGFYTSLKKEKKEGKSMKKILISMALGFALTVSAGNAQAVSIGFDENGAGTFQNIDLWTYRTDTGLATGFIPGQFVPTPNPPYGIDFTLQGRVGSFDNGGIPVIFPGIVLNTKELTFVTKFDETVVSQGFNSAGHQIATFSAGEDINSIFKMYIDTTPDANPNNVSGYTDGLEILSGHLAGLTSSFEAQVPGTLGTGSFDVKFIVDSFDSNYFNLTTDLLLFRLTTTGTLNQPEFFHPTVMWDGTSTEAGVNPQTFKFDGSTGFEVVPEPSTILLLGAGLLGLGVFARRKKA